MRIGILPLAAGRRAGGPETYEVQVTRALARIDKVNEYFLYCPDQAAAEAIGVQQENFVYRILRPSCRPLSIALTLPAWLKKDGINLFHATYAPPPFLNQKMVFTMHGMVNFLHPEFFPRVILWRLNPLMKIGLRRASLIFCVSNHVGDQVHQLLGIPRDRLIVSYLGRGPEFTPIPQSQAREWLAKNLNIDFRYFLYVGKSDPVKNLDRLIRAYADYRQQTRCDTRLVLVGSRTAQMSEGALIRGLGLADWVIQVPYLAHSELPMLYSAAELFLFPSLFESFGLPVVEAMACGTAVLTSNVACLPEITDGAALLVDPTSVSQIAEGIHRLQSSPELRATLSAKGLERAKAFSWDACARTTLAGYGSLLNNST
jgi:glycosyltransferase involved in cell wall biosynthesis